MNGGERIYEALRALDVRTIFAIVSVHNVPIFDAIARRGEIEIVTVRHEQSAAHAADGYARATGQLGVALASTGPGTTNTVTGLYEAAFASSPVLLLTGQVQTSKLGRSQGMLHEAERQAEMLRTVCRNVESPRRAADVVDAIYRTVADIRSGRPQPGAVEIPIDLQHGEMPATDAAPARPSLPQPDDATLAAAADVFGSASRRLIWAGGGVIRSGASPQLIALAEAMDAPVITTLNGRGSIPEDHRLSVGSFTADPNVRQLIAEAEVVLAVGTRFRWHDTQNYSLQIPGRVVHLDADPDVMGRVVEPEVRVVADARLGLDALSHALGGGTGDPAFAEQAAKAAHGAREAARAPMGPDHEAICDHIRESLPRDAPVVRDSTVPAYTWGDRVLPVYEPGTALSPTSAAIGPGLPLAIGAAAGTRRPTFVMHGDGGFMLHVGELATAAQFDLPVKVCVFNDGGYGILRGIQTMRYEGRTIGVDLQTPDFAAVARAMGVPASNVSGVEGFREAFDEAMATDGPYLLDIDMSALAPMSGMGAPRKT